MSAALPSHVKIEVKSSRTEDFSLSKRDIEGIQPNGYAAVLLTNRLLRGPRWVLVPAHVLSPETVTEHDMDKLAEEVDASALLLVQKLNDSWSNWVLDPEAHRYVFEQQPSKLKDAIRWCLEEHPAQENKLQGAVREGKLHLALQEFRSQLDQHVTGESGPQQEGFAHQYLLEHAFTQAGYDVTTNPIGVPDFYATLAGRGKAEILEGWSPDDPALRLIRDQIRGLSDDRRQELFQAIKKDLN